MIWKRISNLEAGRTCTINNKLRSFNYNFFMRNIPYEVRLHKMKIKGNTKCTECSSDSNETILHLYWECNSSRRLWERLEEIVDTHTEHALTLRAEMCLLWITEEECEQGKNRRPLITTLCLLTKDYIHLCKCSGSQRNVVGLSNYIKETYKSEKCIAQQKGTEYLLNVKWGRNIRLARINRGTKGGQSYKMGTYWPGVNSMLPVIILRVDHHKTYIIYN